MLIVTCALIQDAHFPVRGGFAVLALIDSIAIVVAMVHIRYSVSEAAAKRAVRRLTDALLGRGPAPNAAGEREVQRIEARWQPSIEEAQRLRSDSRAVAGWRRALTFTAVLGAACVALALFLWYRAQMRP